MNIMVVSVTERTREIGITKAIGAPRTSILLLIRAALLALIGRVIGVVLGFARSALASQRDPGLPRALLGLVGGGGRLYIPGAHRILLASNAVNLTPIKARRYE